MSDTLEYARQFLEPVFSFQAHATPSRAMYVARTRQPRAWTAQQVDAFHALRTSNTARVREWEPDVSMLAARVDPDNVPASASEVSSTHVVVARTQEDAVSDATTRVACRNPRAPSAPTREHATFSQLYPDIPTTLAEFDARVRTLEDIRRLIPLIGYRPRANTPLSVAISQARKKFDATVDHRY